MKNSAVVMAVKFFVGAPKPWDDSLFWRQLNCRPIGLAR
jgi:hypothetical protein